MAGGYAWQQGVHGRGGMCAVGHAWRWHVCHACPPPHYEIRSVNARAVRILLECILVVYDISSTFSHSDYPMMIATSVSLITTWTSRVNGIHGIPAFQKPCTPVTATTYSEKYLLIPSIQLGEINVENISHHPFDKEILAARL